MASVLLSFVLTLLAAPGAAQVTIHANGVPVPEQKVQILFSTTCRVVAEEFRLPGPSLAGFRVTLVLGDPDERVSGDELNQVYFIYMNRWNEIQFTTSASRLAPQHLVTGERKAKLVREILQRAERVAPVSVQDLHATRSRRQKLKSASGALSLSAKA